MDPSNTQACETSEEVTITDVYNDYNGEEFKLESFVYFKRNSQITHTVLCST